MQNKASKPSAPKPSAFSLIELSIVLIIIGLLAGGIVVGSSLVKRARIESAKSLTNRSPIKETEDLVMWFEDSLLDSFANGQSTNGTSISSGWNNIGGGNEIDSATVDGTASTSTLSCDKTGYTGSATYTCTTTRAATIVSNSCNNINLNCTINGVSGINNGTVVGYGSSSISCNASGWIGAVYYDCYNGVFTEYAKSSSSGCSNSNYTLCRDSSGTAWVSGYGGIYNPTYICKTYGYNGVNAQGGTCGTICGYCSSSGYEYYDGVGGSIYGLYGAVHWRCY